MPKRKAIPCSLLPEVKKRIIDYSNDLKNAAPNIGSHGLTGQKFVESGLFQAAVERLRGTQSATMSVKQEFLREVLNHLKDIGKITDFEFTGASDRHDYQIVMPDGRNVIFEAKGCLDGNNTNIFHRPANADEFFIWSLCQNSGADPEKNAWSGIHTRLGATIVADKERVDGLIVWDFVCGTLGRPCPKLEQEKSRQTKLASGRILPPPCIYLFPRTIPDPRNNASPKSWKLKELTFLKALSEAFKCDSDDITEVKIAAKMHNATVQRKTTLKRGNTIVAESDWTDLKRAR